MRATLLVGAVLTCLVMACAGGDDDDDDVASPSPSPSPSPTSTAVVEPTPDFGTSSGTLRLSGELIAIAGGGTTTYSLYVMDASDVPITDATVQVNGFTLTQDDPGGDPGHYTGGDSPATVPATFEIDVTRGADFITNMILPVPPDFTLATNPNPPVEDTAALVTWDSPVYWTSVLAEIFALYDDGMNVSNTCNLYDLPDDGSETVPGATFPGPGDYSIETSRVRIYTLPSPGNALSVKSQARATFTLP